MCMLTTKLIMRHACPGFLECRILLLHDVIANFNKVSEFNSIYMAAQHQLLCIIIITEYIYQMMLA